MIKELAPLYLLVKEELNEDTLMIIEEPEAHLHPGAQNMLMEIFSEIINNSGHLILTTHSDIILRKIGNLVGFYKIKEFENIALNKDSVSIYHLKIDVEGSTSEIIPIPDDGTFEELPEFDKVIIELYETQLRTQQKIQSVK